MHIHVLLPLLKIHVLQQKKIINKKIHIAFKLLASNQWKKFLHTNCIKDDDEMSKLKTEVFMYDKQLEALEKSLVPQPKTTNQLSKRVNQKVSQKSEVPAVSPSLRKKINKFQIFQKNAESRNIKSQISLANCLIKCDVIKQDC